MTMLTPGRRGSLPGSEFGMPKIRAYPMPDRAHAASAKTQATQQYEAGNLTQEQHDSIHAKANRILARPAGKMSKANQT